MIKQQQQQQKCDVHLWYTNVCVTATSKYLSVFSKFNFLDNSYIKWDKLCY